MVDLHFPELDLVSSKSPKECGLHHGEHLREAIQELALIRKDLLLQKRPSFSPFLKEMALEQWKHTQHFSPSLVEELEGIALGANLEITDLVILNNYTDFRDLPLPEQGCSTVHHKALSCSGQTWDMHSSAQRFLCVLKLKSSYILTVAGCVGLMGINEHGLLLGVNNINTTNARPGIIWPVLVRRCLEEKSFSEMEKILLKAPVTSGHAYLLSSKDQGALWEVTPTLSRKTGELSLQNTSPWIFHTNHCLNEEIKTLEDSSSLSSTTFARYSLLETLLPNINSWESFLELLHSHEGYPKSLCSHYQSGLQDPSQTCGGGAINFKTHQFVFWRGCPKTGNYRERTYNLIS